MDGVARAPGRNETGEENRRGAVKNETPPPSSPRGAKQMMKQAAFIVKGFIKRETPGDLPDPRENETLSPPPSRQH